MVHGPYFNKFFLVSLLIVLSLINTSIASTSLSPIYRIGGNEVIEWDDVIGDEAYRDETGQEWITYRANIREGYWNSSIINEDNGDINFAWRSDREIGERSSFRKIKFHKNGIVEDLSFSHDISNNILWEHEGPVRYHRDAEYKLDFLFSNFGTTIWVAFPPTGGLNHLSADEDRQTIRRYMANAGQVVNITPGRDLSFIISLSRGKELRLSEGPYPGEIDQISIDNISIKGDPEATIIGTRRGCAIFRWNNSRYINISNISFQNPNSDTGISLMECNNFNISHIKIIDFGQEDAVQLFNSNFNELRDICIYSNDPHTTGFHLNNSKNNSIIDNNIQVTNAVYFLESSSNNNTIFNGNDGDIYDNGMRFNFTYEFYYINNSPYTRYTTHANNDWQRGSVNPCN